MKRKMKTLANGMKVILIEKPDFARSLFMIGVPAGSTNLVDEHDNLEVSHPLGCAHFLEHKMFRLNGKDVTYDLAAVQAKSNAFTSYNETCYYVWTNADPIAPLDILIDFVQTLDIDEESVEKEKGIILSEYSQYDQDPEMRLLKETFVSLYHNHPLRYDILGKPEDISAMTEEDLRAFYDVWYDPSQLTLVGITGRDTDELMAWIEEKEKQYPAKFARPARKLLPEEEHDVFRPRHTLRMDVDLSYVCVGVKLDPATGSNNDVVREDYMLNLWLNGVFSTMNPDCQTWLDQQLIGPMFGAEADVDRDHGYMLIYAQSDRPDEFCWTMTEELQKKTPLSREVFESVLIREKATAIRLMDNFDGLAQQSVRQSFTGYDPLDDVDILNSITYEEFNEWIARQDFSRTVETIVLPLARDEENDQEEDSSSAVLAA